VNLSAEKQNQLFIPAGFAHGFLALTERVQFLYKCSDFYSAQEERGILWNDPAIGIQWPISDPLISEKDAKHPTLANAPWELLPHYLEK
jgi:dTDP-4-dehydrorhamnose 3,5-epimerase